MPANDLQNNINRENQVRTSTAKTNADLSKTSTSAATSPTTKRSELARGALIKNAVHLRQDHKEDLQAAHRIRQGQVQQQVVTTQGQQGLIARMRSAITGVTSSQNRAGHLVQEEAAKTERQGASSPTAIEKVDTRITNKASNRVEPAARRKEASATAVDHHTLQQGSQMLTSNSQEQLEAEAILTNSSAPSVKDKEEIRKALRIIQMPIALSTRHKTALQFFPISEKAHQYWKHIAQKGGPIAITRAKVQQLARWTQGREVHDDSDSFAE